MIDHLLKLTERTDITLGRICCKGHTPTSDMGPGGYVVSCPKCGIKTFPRTYEKQAKNDWNNKVLY